MIFLNIKKEIEITNAINTNAINNYFLRITLKINHLYKNNIQLFFTNYELQFKCFNS